MSPLSPNYRQDDTAAVPADVREYLDEHFLSKLDNLDVSHPRLLVVFSGANGVGKSSLAARIKQDLQALVLENDAIKTELMRYLPDADRDTRNTLTWQYSMDLYRRLGQVTPNGLVVRDGVIDWYYDRILPVFMEQRYRLFVVGFDVTEQKRLKLLKQRGDKATVSVERLIHLFADHDIHMTRFRRKYTPDIILRDDDLFDYDQVIAQLISRLAE